MATQAAVSPRPVLTASRSQTVNRRKIKWGTVARHVVLMIFSLIIILPIVWVLLLSVKSLPDAYQNDIWPKNFDWSHYGYSLSKIPTLPQNYTNSIVVTLGTVVVTTVCAVLAGYAIVFLEVPGIKILFFLLVASMFFPTRVTAVIAIFETQKDLGLLNVPAGLIFPYVTLSLALSVFVMRGMFQTVPMEIYDAARIDGAGRVRMLLGILLPMVKNGIVVVIIVNFVTAWGEYLLAKTLNTNQSAQTLPVVLATATGGMGAWVWPRLAAVYIMAITPGLLVFAFAQRWYMKGLQEGALKA
jgi:ABC-type glycerol-3-phosphate transport system permease component